MVRGKGRYYSGLNETGRFTLCPADDDITREFTDPQEDSAEHRHWHGLTPVVA